MKVFARPTPGPSPQAGRGVPLGIILHVFFLVSCTSGSDQDVRNKDIFNEAQQLTYATFTTTPINFSGNINGLITEAGTGINAQAASTTNDSVYAGSFATIEGMVTLPSDFGFGIGASGCAVSNRVFARSFILQDANAAVLVVYGLEPPSQDNADAARMVHINNARKYDMAILGNRMRLTVTRVQNYGSSGNNIPIITDFSNPVVISTRNSVPYSTQTSAFVRASDLYHMRRIEGYVSSKPLNVECSTGTRQFQYDYQSGYSGELCLGAVSACGSLTCTCSATKLKFHLSHNLGAGTLSGFDTGNSFSYTLAAGAKVRLTGPIYVPGQGGADSTLALMLGLKVQVETLR